MRILIISTPTVAFWSRSKELWADMASEGTTSSNGSRGYDSSNGFVSIVNNAVYIVLSIKEHYEHSSKNLIADV